jgi:hypothetical protein
MSRAVKVPSLTALSCSAPSQRPRDDAAQEFVETGWLLAALGVTIITAPSFDALLPRQDRLTLQRCAALLALPAVVVAAAVARGARRPHLPSARSGPSWTHTPRLGPAGGSRSFGTAIRERSKAPGSMLL